MTINILLRVLVTALVSYLLGSFSFAVIFTRLSLKKDIRDMGSGNAGFTNVLRTVGTTPAILTFAFDFIKGIIAVFIGWWIFSGVNTADSAMAFECVTYGRYLAGLFAVIGHMFPLYFSFKGGKGVVTTAALMAVVDWRVFLMILATFGIMFLCTKIISLSSIVCAAAYGIYTFIITFFVDYLGRLDTEGALTIRYVIISTGCALFIGILVIIKHKDNIKRLINGEEKKITAKK